MTRVLLALAVLVGCGPGVGKPCQSGHDCASSFCRNSVCAKKAGQGDGYIYVPVPILLPVGK